VSGQAETQEEHERAYRNIAICMGDEGFKADDVRTWDAEGSTSRFWREVAEAMDSMEAGKFDVDAFRALMIAEDERLRPRDGAK
jgi:hypothetical protein